MADQEQQRERQLSLVPYTSDSQEIVLRHGHSVVVFDPESRQLSLHGNVQDAVELGDCPYCHRPLRDNTGTRQFTDENGPPSSDEQTFVDPEYFRMLAHSIPGSATSSPRPASPLKQLPPLRSGGSRNVSSSEPPTGAEFVGSAPMPQTSDQGIRGSSFLPGYFSAFFTEKRELGRGGKGVVLLVEHLLDGVFLGEYACKRIPVGNDHSWLAKVLVEVQLLQRLNHQNLVSYRHVWLEDAQTTNFGPPVPCIFILQQYCNAGDLHEYIVGSMRTTENPEMLKERMRRRSKGHETRPLGLNGPRKIPFDEVFSFFRDITSGLHHLHTNGYIHRDLKPQNCLLHRSGQKLTAHVSDFGEVQATNEKRTSTGATGTISYCAPEVLTRNPGSPEGTYGDFTTKSDIFSLGMIVYFMCFGRLPYQHADNLNEETEDLDALRSEVSAWKGFNDNTRTRTDLPEKLYRFLKKLLSPDPQERPSTEQILQAIKTGTGLDDMDISGPRSPDLINEITGSRISAVESPRPQKNTRGSGVTGPTRPGLSKLQRQYSGEMIQHSRSPPPPPPSFSSIPPQPSISQRRSSKDGITTATTETGQGEETTAVMTLRSPRLGASATLNTRPPPTNPANSVPTTSIPTTGTAKQMPRQLLPPPPQSPPSTPSTPPTTMIKRLLAKPPKTTLLLLLKIASFALKFFTATWPCDPFVPRPWVLYPLLGLALLDFTVSEAGLGMCLVLLGVHLGVLGVVRGGGALCSIGGGGGGLLGGGGGGGGVGGGMGWDGGG